LCDFRLCDSGFLSTAPIVAVHLFILTSRSLRRTWQREMKTNTFSCITTYKWFPKIDFHTMSWNNDLMETNFWETKSESSSWLRAWQEEGWSAGASNDCEGWRLKRKMKMNLINEKFQCQKYSNTIHSGQGVHNIVCIRLNYRQ
jgi:hypothetical protein